VLFPELREVSPGHLVAEFEDVGQA
jgi:hypothetical protein